MINMKRKPIETPDVFKPFRIDGTQAYVLNMVEYCSQCPAMKKDDPKVSYGDGLCTVRNVRKKRIDKTPYECRKRMANGAKEGGVVNLNY